MKDYLTIGEISSLFRVNVQTLHYYDAQKLLVPEKRSDANGYRLYRFDQIYKLASIRYMRKLGYSLEQIKQYDKGYDVAHSLNMLKERSDELKKQWEETMRIDAAITRKIRFIEKELPNINMERIEVLSFPERHYMPIGEEELLYRDDSFYFYPTVVFYEGETKKFGAYLFGELEAQGFENACVIPAGQYLCGYHKGPYESIMDTNKCIRQAGQHYKLSEQAIDFNIIDQFVEREKANYITHMQIRILTE